MPVSDDFLEYVKDQLLPTGEVTPKRMFGGAGLYLEGIFFAIVADDVLYFKVDDSNRADYERAGTGPFRPFGGKTEMQYYEVPVEVLEDRDALAVWANRALAVTARSRSQGSRKRR